MANATPKQPKSSKAPSNETPRPAPWPTKPEGFKRIPLVAAFLDADEMHGVLLDVEQVEDERGESVHALVFLASMPTRCRTTHGQAVEVGANQPVHVASPALLKLVPLATDAKVAYPCIVYRQRIGGRTFYAVDVRSEPVERSTLKPEKLALPAA